MLFLINGCVVVISPVHTFTSVIVPKKRFSPMCTLHACVCVC